jgi:hypothetical protein
MQGHEPVGHDRPPSSSNPVDVTGTLEMVGGPPSGPTGTTPRRAVSGSIYFEAEDGRITSAEAGSDGRFTIAVPPGRYTVSADRGLGWISCFARQNPIDAPADGLNGVEVTCLIR